MAALDRKVAQKEVAQKKLTEEKHEKARVKARADKDLADAKECMKLEKSQALKRAKLVVMQRRQRQAEVKIEQQLEEFEVKDDSLIARKRKVRVTKVEKPTEETAEEEAEEAEEEAQLEAQMEAQYSGEVNCIECVKLIFL